MALGRKTPSDPFEDMQKAMLKNYASQLQQMQQQHVANQNALHNQLNQKGAGQVASNYGGLQGAMQQLQNIQFTPQGHIAAVRPNKPMQPNRFQPGMQVTVRSGKTVWRVEQIEQRQIYGGFEWRYLLRDEQGRSSSEEEADLRMFNDGAIPAAKKSQVNFDTVIISQEKRNQILEAIEQINQNDLIFNKWGFGETIEKGKGVSMLFYGPPGTGKTLMAQAIANKLGYVLKVIASADIESSAPGEAERNIRKHFSDAKGAKTILLFDECDSLIYTRQNTGPIMGAQVNELLSQIERFDGITLFTTNRLGTLDEAVNRRLALKLEFEMPSLEERVEIWKRMFPKAAPLDKDIEWSRLAIIEVTGGYIKNAVLRAARMAATEKVKDKDKKIRMKHLVQAIKLETESMIEFEDAREEHRHGYGRVVGNTVQRGRGGIQKVQGNTQKVEGTA